MLNLSIFKNTHSPNPRSCSFVRNSSTCSTSQLLAEQRQCLQHSGCGHRNLGARICASQQPDFLIAKLFSGGIRAVTLGVKSSSDDADEEVRRH